MEYYLGIDIGASSGRHMLAHMEDGKLVLEEMHRFENGLHEENGQDAWDTEHLFSEIKEGMKKCAAAGKIPKTVGIDTWGVDFVLLDENDRMLGPAVGYRDSRTDGMDDEVRKFISDRDLYARTGIQKAIFNTIYQLTALRVKQPELLNQAKTMLFIPDYFNFLLTGKKRTEYTFATTAQLVSPETKDWDRELMELLGIPTAMLQEVTLPGTVLGPLTDEVAAEVGFQTTVIMPAEHDTASAVLSVPSVKETVYISSGTWSLLGIEREEADTSDAAREANFTNEGGYQYRYRFLKNIMGLWMIQEVRRELIAKGEKYSFAELCDLAEEADCDSIVDCNSDRFLAPDSMTLEIRDACREQGAKVPVSAGELARVIYRSLAVCYDKAVRGIEKITGKRFDRINVVGGGANASYLNRLTAAATRCTVYAGPTEATAIGNILVQMMTEGLFQNLNEARECVFHSFDINTFRED